MTAKTLTISMSQEDYEYLKQDGLLSASKIFQVALANIKINREQDINQIRLLQNKCNILQTKVFELQDEIHGKEKKKD